MINLQGKWEEITEESFWYYLEAVPPKRRCRIHPEIDSFFFVGECYTGTLYRACIQYKGKYFSARRCITLSNEELAANFFAQVNS